MRTRLLGAVLAVLLAAAALPPGGGATVLVVPQTPGVVITSTISSAPSRTRCGSG